jgi:hypothetical protein
MERENGEKCERRGRSRKGGGVMSEIIKLDWRAAPSSRRSRKANAPNGIYFIQAIDDGFVLTLQGVRLAKASTMRGAQDYASIHVNKARSSEVV